MTRSFFSSVIFVASLLLAGQSIAQDSAALERSLTVKKGEAVPDGIAMWDINPQIHFVVRYNCSRDGLLDIKKLFSDCEGFVSLKYEKTVSELNIERAEIESTYSRGREPEPTLDLTEMISVSGLTGSPSELFKLIATEREPVLTAQNVNFKLEDFGTVLDAEKSKERERTYVGILLWLSIALACLTVIVILVKLVKFIKTKIPKIKEEASCWTHNYFAKMAGLMSRLLSRYQKFHVRRVVLDETIRQTTRSALAATSDEEKTALQKQIKLALDIGNHELAKTLISILQKLGKK